MVCCECRCWLYLVNVFGVCMMVGMWCESMVYVYVVEIGGLVVEFFFGDEVVLYVIVNSFDEWCYWVVVVGVMEF